MLWIVHGAVFGLVRPIRRARRDIHRFPQATGAGPRNAFEYGHVARVHVSAAHAMRTLALDGIAG